MLVEQLPFQAMLQAHSDLGLKMMLVLLELCRFMMFDSSPVYCDISNDNVAERRKAS